MPVALPDMHSDITFPTSDGRQINGQLYRPAELTDDQPAVVIHPATGVHMGLYAKFAEYLAEQGMPALIYDFRGTGKSEQPGDLSDKSLLMSDWMLLDVPAANRFMRKEFPARRLVAVGHSVGAHGSFMSFADEPVDAIAAIASHAGITKLIPEAKERARIWTVFNVITPLTARVLGHVPVAKIGMGRDIPVGVMTQWSRWTRKPGYFFDDKDFPGQGHTPQERFAKVTAPVLSVVFTDDLWATREASDVLVDKLSGAEVERRDISPESIGVKSIGHMGFFRSANRQLWPAVAEWVQQA